MATLLICLLVGMVLGQRFRVFVLVPAAVCALAVSVGEGLTAHQSAGSLALAALMALATLQVGYFAGVVVRHLIAPARAGKLGISFPAAAPVDAATTPTSALGT